MYLVSFNFLDFFVKISYSAASSPLVNTYALSNFIGLSLAKNSKSLVISQMNGLVGWFDNPKKLFYSNTLFTIYEVDWGKPYAARFKIWFVPDLGGKERKLTEKIFKMEGWQR